MVTKKQPKFDLSVMGRTELPCAQFVGVKKIMKPTTAKIRELCKAADRARELSVQRVIRGYNRSYYASSMEAGSFSHIHVELVKWQGRDYLLDGQNRVEAALASGWRGPISIDLLRAGTFDELKGQAMHQDPHVSRRSPSDVVTAGTAEKKGKVSGSMKSVVGEISSALTKLYLGYAVKRTDQPFFSGSKTGNLAIRKEDAVRNAIVGFSEVLKFAHMLRIKYGWSPKKGVKSGVTLAFVDMYVRDPAKTARIWKKFAEAYNGSLEDSRASTFCEKLRRITANPVAPNTGGSVRQARDYYATLWAVKMYLSKKKKADDFDPSTIYPLDGPCRKANLQGRICECGKKFVVDRRSKQFDCGACHEKSKASSCAASRKSKMAATGAAELTRRYRKAGRAKRK